MVQHCLVPKYLFKHKQKVGPAKCPSTGNWTKKPQHDHRMEYHITANRKGITLHAIVWMNYEDLVLNELNKP